MYPVTYAADNIEPRNRLSTLLRIIYAIPAVIVLTLFSIVAFILAIVAWFAILFTGRYPQGLYDFNAKLTRMSGRITSYEYLVQDPYPPFNGDPDDSYPVRVNTPGPLPEYNRLKTGLRFIVGIPAAIMNYVWTIIGGVCALIGWFAVLFTGKMPEGLFNPIRNAMRYNTQTTAYFLLLTEDWPPFSEEPPPEPAKPAGTLQAGVQSAAAKVQDAAATVRDKASEIAQRNKPDDE
jgi:uncharacterized protein DUF4389